MNDFDSTYSIAEEINRKVGGESKNFDSTYSICKEILDKVEGGGGGGTTYEAGENIEISDNNVISATGYKGKNEIYSEGFAELPEIPVEVWLSEPRQLTAEEKEEVGNYEWYSNDDTEYPFAGCNIYRVDYENNDDGDRILIGKVSDCTYISDDEFDIHGMIFNTVEPVEFPNPEDTEYTVVYKSENNIADGHCSHSEGGNNISSGAYSHTQGTNNMAGGYASTACGESCGAAGSYSFINGLNCSSDANATCSTAFGNNIETKNPNEFATGVYNRSVTGTTDATKIMFSIGNGTNQNNRKNIITALKGGEIYVNGVGGFDGVHFPFEGYGCYTLQDTINSPQCLSNRAWDALNMQSVQVYGNPGCIQIASDTTPTLEFLTPANYGQEVRMDILVLNSGYNSYRVNLTGAYQLMTNNGNNTISDGDYVLYICRWIPVLETWLVIPTYKEVGIVE